MQNARKKTEETREPSLRFLGVFLVLADMIDVLQMEEKCVCANFEMNGAEEKTE